MGGERDSVDGTLSGDVRRRHSLFFSGWAFTVTGPSFQISHFVMLEHSENHCEMLLKIIN